MAVLLFTVLSFLAQAEAAPCPAAPIAVGTPEVQNDFIVEHWEGRDYRRQQRLGRPAAGSFVAAHEAAVRRAIPNVNPVQLLTDDFRYYEGRKELKRFLEVAHGETGKLRAISCLEQALMERHLARYPLGSIPYTELQALVLVDGRNLNHFRVEIALSEKDGAATGGTRLMEIAREYTERGWIAAMQFHNHPFNPTNPSGDTGGNLVASGTAQYGDVSFYLTLVSQLRLRGAVISNGIHSVAFSQYELLNKLSKW